MYCRLVDKILYKNNKIQEAILIFSSEERGKDEITTRSRNDKGVLT